MTNTDHKRAHERALAALRVRSLELRLVLAHIDEIGLLLRDNLIAPWGAMAALADLNRKTEGAADE